MTNLYYEQTVDNNSLITSLDPIEESLLRCLNIWVVSIKSRLKPWNCKREFVLNFFKWAKATPLTQRRSEGIGYWQKRLWIRTMIWPSFCRKAKDFQCYLNWSLVTKRRNCDRKLNLYYGRGNESSETNPSLKFPQGHKSWCPDSIFLK